MSCCVAIAVALTIPTAPNTGWKKHVIATGFHNTTAVAADFTGDGKIDVICPAAGKVRLFAAPDWKEIDISPRPGLDAIHSAVLDCDGDGRPDFVGAGYSPGHLYWLRRPANPLKDRWEYRLIDDRIDGIHGVLVGDVDRDGRPDLIANSGQPKGPFAHSAVWLKAPKDVLKAERWDRHVFAKGDAANLSHYFGFGDVNGDGRPDIALAAKGEPANAPNANGWFAWWEQPVDPTRPWTKHLIAAPRAGATNIQQADVNGDGKIDFIATRGHGRGVYWFEAPDWKEHTIHATLLEPHCLAVADLDGDGDVDAATCGYGDKLALWFENDGKGRFTTHLVARDQAAYDIRAVDMDGDGDLDLLIAGQQSQNVAWYENPRK